jgi:hypothetical protein
VTGLSKLGRSSAENGSPRLQEPIRRFSSNPCVLAWLCSSYAPPLFSRICCPGPVSRRYEWLPKRCEKRCEGSRSVGAPRSARVELTCCSLANNERDPWVTPTRDVALAVTPTVAARTLRVLASLTRPADALHSTLTAPRACCAPTRRPP